MTSNRLSSTDGAATPSGRFPRANNSARIEIAGSELVEAVIGHLETLDHRLQLGIAGAEADQILRQLQKHPEVKVLPHVDNAFVMDSTRRAVARAGYNLEV